MKVNNKHLSGDFFEILNITKNWAEVEISLLDADVRPDRYMSIANKSEEYFTDLYDDERAVLRFQNDDDAMKFNAEYHYGQLVY